MLKAHPMMALILHGKPKKKKPKEGSKAEEASESKAQEAEEKKSGKDLY